jgi:hypothetical protein
MSMSPDQFDAYFRSEVEANMKIVAAARIAIRR